MNEWRIFDQVLGRLFFDVLPAVKLHLNNIINDTATRVDLSSYLSNIEDAVPLGSCAIALQVLAPTRVNDDLTSMGFSTNLSNTLSAISIAADNATDVLAAYMSDKSTTLILSDQTFYVLTPGSAERAGWQTLRNSLSGTAATNAQKLLDSYTVKRVKIEMPAFNDVSVVPERITTLEALNTAITNAGVA